MSIDSSWTEYMLKQAPRGILCQFTREGGKPWVGMPDDLDHELNTVNLYWRLTGIGREQLKGMPELLYYRVPARAVGGR